MDWPEDIMKAAKTLAGEWSSINTREYEGDFKADLAEDFAAAIFAERERCADIARNASGPEEAYREIMNESEINGK